MIEPAIHRLEPRRRALQTICGADVEHQEPVDVADQRVVVEIARQQLRVPGRHATVTAYVQVPALLGGDDADVLALRLRALAGTPRDGHLDLVWRPQTAIPLLDADRHVDRILLTEAAPGASDATLHRPQRLAVGVAGFHPAVDQSAPDRRQLIHPRAEHVD